MSSNPQTPCRIRTSSSVLCALSSLTPPSPILSPSQLCSTWTSGEIPILFNSPSVTSLSSSTSVSGGVCGITPCLSAQTVETMCTFGPTSRKSDQVRSEKDITDDTGSLTNSDFDISIKSMSMSSIATPMVEFVTPEERYPQACSVVCTRSLSATSACFAHPSRSSGLPVVSGLEVGDWSLSPNQASSAFKFPSSSSVPCTSPEYKENDYACEQILRYVSPSQTFSMLPTPSFAPPSPSPSVDLALYYPSSPRSRRKFHFDTEYLAPGQDDTGERHGISRMPLEEQPRNTQVLKGQSYSIHSSSTPYSPTAAGPYFPAYNRNAEVPRDSVQASRQGSASASYLSVTDPKDSFLPRHLSWLKDITVELLIDQEGFRSIQPSFKLIGYTHLRHTGSHSDAATVDDGVVEFMPTKRRSFIFHYAPFDGLPTLRRITVNGNESRDYISRQASLSLKSNGVYTVRGTETSSLPSYLSGNNSSPGSDNAKLKWKFDYIVDDRRVEATGRIMDGEKMLTPLTFSCSPALLHSLQGKKIRLMHIVRKSVIPNLIAEKVEPPNMPMRSVPSMSNLKTTIQNTYFAKSHAWNKHRRTKSNVVPHGDEEPLIRKSPHRSGLNNPGAHSQISSKLLENRQQIRRRRASSAGERNRNETMENTAPSFQAAKHIVPPSQLCELLSMGTEDATLVASQYKPHLGALAYSPPKLGRVF